MTAASLTLDAMRVTQAAGLKLRLLPDAEMGRVECGACGHAFDVVLTKWVALPPRERGCPPCSVRRITP